MGIDILEKNLDSFDILKKFGSSRNVNNLSRIQEFRVKCLLKS